MATIYFTRRFTGGALKGLVHHDSASGPDAAALARFWRVGRKVKRSAISPSPYEIIDASFQKYTR